VAHPIFDEITYPRNRSDARNLEKVLIEIAKGDNAKWICQTYTKCGSNLPGLTSPNTPEGLCQEVLDKLALRNALREFCKFAKDDFKQTHKVVRAIEAVENASAVEAAKRVGTSGLVGENRQIPVRLTKRAIWVISAAVGVALATAAFAAVWGPWSHPFRRPNGVTITLTVDPSNRFGDHAVTVSRNPRTTVFLLITIGQRGLNPLIIPKLSMGGSMEVPVPQPRGDAGEELEIRPDDCFHMEAWENNGSDPPYPLNALLEPIDLPTLRPLIGADNVVRFTLGK
jgi:hypothetical protein